MAKNIEHYSIDKIKSLNADINLIYGERSNGKSYQVKHVIALDTFLSSYNRLSKESLLTESINELKRFFLLRRFEVEIKNNFVEKYFADVDTEVMSLSPTMITHGGPGCVLVQAIKK